MSRCPNCEQWAEFIVHNLADGTRFCAECAPPSFLPHYILTADDIAFLKSCGVDPQIPMAVLDGSFVRLVRREPA